MALTRTRPIANLMRRQVQAALTQESDEPLAVGEILQNLLAASPSSTPRPDHSPEQHRRLMFRRANLPKRHERTRGHETNPEWIKQNGTVLEALGGGFLIGLIGKRGTGKTQMAMQAAVKSITVGRQPLYVKAMDVFFCVRSAFKSEVLTELDVLAEFLAPDLLILDELGERGESEWEDRTLVYLIDKRYDAMKDTLLISNMTAAAFEESMGTSIASRLRECGGFVECNWESFRL